MYSILVLQYHNCLSQYKGNFHKEAAALHATPATGRPATSQPRATGSRNKEALYL